MQYVINGRKPEAFFRYFEEISAIPRGSYNERGIADYLENFAKERGLFCYRDEVHNVLIKAPATPGWENREPIMFQGHTDMVCEKNRDVAHDFLRDPLKLYVDGALLRAKGTTLGADDGIAVAVMLALLDGTVPEHPAYECLFTVSEEVGLDGAHAFDYSKLDARRMVNIDSEQLGVITAGCAGGLRTDLILNTHTEPFSGEALRVSITGLIGGHSGEAIHLGRANANKLMGRLLATLQSKTEVRVVSVNGGSKDNAIPRECEAILSVADTALATDVLLAEAEEIAAELVAEDRGFTLCCEESGAEASMLSLEESRRVIAILSGVPNGVFEMNRSIQGLVEFSRNLGVVRTEVDSITFLFAARSAMESRLDASMAELEALGAAHGCRVEHHNRYPGWNFSENSPLREAYLAAYREATGSEAVVNVIHAGLECGIISSKVPGMDMISVAPNVYNLHSPDEAMDLDSAEVFWQTLVALIPKL